MVAREFVPPGAVRLARLLQRAAAGKVRGRDAPTGAAPSDYYDRLYEESRSYRRPYFESIYYPLWSVVVDRLVASDAVSVLDVGCGPGQFAALLAERTSLRYLGVDFSPVAVGHAAKACPECEFRVGDVTEDGTLAASDYDCVLLLEVLEHVDDDRAMLADVRPGARVMLTVPNFADPAHLRCFESEERVAARYGSLFSTARVDSFRLTADDKRLFLLDGIRDAE